MRKYKIDWTLTYRDGSTCEGSTLLRAENDADARSKLAHRDIGTFSVTKVHDQGEVDPPTKPFTVSIPDVKY